jgi:hypothetical protein
MVEESVAMKPDSSADSQWEAGQWWNKKCNPAWEYGPIAASTHTFQAVAFVAA